LALKNNEESVGVKQKQEQIRVNKEKIFIWIKSIMEKQDVDRSTGDCCNGAISIQIVSISGIENCEWFEAKTRKSSTWRLKMEDEMQKVWQRKC
jgi:hypothetical protein